MEFLVKIKSILFLLSFYVLHFGYKLTRWKFLKPFCGINESVFQHLKIAFWGYVVLTGIEYFLLSGSAISNISSFIFSRLLSAIMIPWIVGLIWYLLPALYGRAGRLWLDLVWGTFSTYLSGFFVIQIERDIERVQFELSTEIIIVILCIISAFLFTLFTYRLPWIDLFVDPKSERLRRV